MGRNWYAIELPYGVASDGNTGRMLGAVACFGSSQARDAWVAKGNPYSTQKGHRRALKAHSPEVRYAQRWEAWAGPEPTDYEQCGF
jgi:hypothetical protein